MMMHPVNPRCQKQLFDYKKKKIYEKIKEICNHGKRFEAIVGDGTKTG